MTLGWGTARSSSLETSAATKLLYRELCVGDVCLPPDHADVVRTPDLSDRFRRFQFSDPAAGTGTGSETVPEPTTPSASLAVASTTLVRPVAIKNNMVYGSGSPPASPATPTTTKAPKTPKEKDPDKPKRPMNGFMLFAKKYRLELIQQHPGKDNRSVCLLYIRSVPNIFSTQIF